MNSDDKSHAIVWSAFWGFMAVLVICIALFNILDDSTDYPPRKSERDIFIEECTKQGGNPHIESNGGWNNNIDKFECKK